MGSSLQAPPLPPPASSSVSTDNLSLLHSVSSLQYLYIFAQSQPSLRSLNLCSVSYCVQNKTLKPLIFRPLCQNFFSDVRFSSGRVPPLSQTQGTNFLLRCSMFSEFSFGRFLLAFVMTKLISAILITFQPFGVNLKLCPKFTSRSICSSLSTICADNIFLM